MSGLYSKYIKLIHFLGDIAAIAISIVLAYVLSHSVTDEPNYLVSFLFSLTSWLLCTALLGTYKVNRVTRRINVVFTALKAILLYIVLIEAGLNLAEIVSVPREALFLHYLILTCLIVFWRVAVTTALRIYRRNGYNLRNVIIAGLNDTGLELEYFFKMHPEYGYNFLGFFDNKSTDGVTLKGRISEIETFALLNDVDEIYCCPYELDKHEITQLLDFADNNLIRIKFLPVPGSQPYQKLKIDFNDVFPVLLVRALPLDDVINKFIKRAFDIVFSLAVILFVLSWLIPLVALAIKITSKGPVFFKQTRSGIDNKDFQCYKLRSMYVNDDANLLLARKGDSRITPVGAFIRKTSIDELPQFFNVLLGQMSIVGPRPHMLKLGEEYAQVANKYMVRHFIKPGITGLSQVRGYRGDTSELYQIRGRVKLDIFYLVNWSFLLDLKIIFYTIYNVVKGDKAAF
ncbi:undecaprenyl-phosphate glucose phosphotransferase [Pontibacter sp. 172403-2]|uniref:undecaprenyl-phosphate glucose phosphotransferase n=1 Tax=Pontibacter rufus TaxID=2791028 RepID=UPI0018AFE9F9|nr:undecaprenyl-phosphate glucose phosphotransferase [Pontibacter sp. 172403-2]MBF9254973.1 undecaprenyl-phosphate glucose phosphotransferase [Pontibacter sp. 172403-2]